jgi:hypothetical protein
MVIQNTLGSWAECLLIPEKIGHSSIYEECPIFFPDTLNNQVYGAQNEALLDEVGSF